MIYLDTHVVVWLYEGLIEKLSSNAIDLIEKNDLLISPLLELELTYLYETKKITRTSAIIVRELQSRLALEVCDISFETVIHKAQSLTWTRDPFDRMMVAQALCKNAKFLTKDAIIRKHCKSAVWD